MRLKYSFLLVAFFALSCEKKKEAPTLDNVTQIKSLDAGEYDLNLSKSSLSWVGKEITTKIHTGTIDIIDGKVTISETGEVTGVISLDMKTINVTDLEGKSKEYLEGHLNSEDFFGVDKYPDAKLTFSSKSGILKNKIAFNGLLTIKSITEKVEFDAVLAKGSPNIVADANLTFDRTKFNVRYRSGLFFDNLGDKLILDDIDVQIKIAAELQ
jgi:polyisoprenoid-binding protein YceI